MILAPVIYEHAAAFLGRTPWDVSRSVDLMVEAHCQAYQFYRHTPITVGIDIYNVEAEAYGATVEGSDGIEVPSIRKPPLESISQLLELALPDPEHHGRCPLVLEAASRVASRFPEAEVHVPLGGPFSVASNLLGFEELLMSLMTEEDEVAAALMHIAEGQLQFARAAISRGLGVTLFESAATPPMVSPSLFNSAVLPALKLISREIRILSGTAPAWVLGGNTAPILSSVLEIDPGFLICPAETDQSAFMNQMKEYPDISVRVNMDAEVLSRGDPAAVDRELKRVLSLSRKRPNTMAGTGVLPYNADREKIRTLIRRAELPGGSGESVTPRSTP